MRGGADCAYISHAGIPSIDSLGLIGGDLDSIASQAKLIAVSILEMIQE